LRSIRTRKKTPAQKQANETKMKMGSAKSPAFGMFSLGGGSFKSGHRGAEGNWYGLKKIPRGSGEGDVIDYECGHSSGWRIYKGHWRSGSIRRNFFNAFQKES